MKIVYDKMGEIKVGCFGKKSKGNHLDSWTVGQLAVGQNHHAIARSGDQAILHIILDWHGPPAGGWNLEFYLTTTFPEYLPCTVSTATK
jgi:hypothetical protein